MSGGRVYPDKTPFDAGLDRLIGICLKFNVAAQKQGSEIQTAVQSGLPL